MNAHSAVQRPAKLRLGIDVGGTNTDAVLMAGREVLAFNKSATTQDVTAGLVEAVTRLLEASQRSASDLGHVMIGTTQFVNAFVERRDLEPVAVVRIGSPCGDGVPPLIGFPADLLEHLGRNIFWLPGGADVAGKAVGTTDAEAVRQLAEEIASRGIRSVALTGIFSPLRPEIEDEVAALLLEELPGLHVTCSARVGGVGLVDRENAAIVNASLTRLSRKVIDALALAFAQLGIDAPIYLTQNDGTLISTELAARYPVFTCAAGPTNSIRGAAFLAGVEDAVVVDVGGTTADIGYLLRGFPRETALPNLIGGVRTNMRMPDILSIPLGGGTRVIWHDGAPRFGPQSVGHRLQTDALVFGGDVLTATDIAVRAGAASMGDASRVAHLDEADAAEAMKAMHALVDDAIDRVRVSGNPIPVILVGGGRILLPEAFAGGPTIVPELGAVANAIGAAIATVSGRIDRIFDLEALDRAAAVATASDAAMDAAVEAGAERETVELVELIELPVGHMSGEAVRICARAVGALREVEHV